MNVVTNSMTVVEFEALREACKYQINVGPIDAAERSGQAQLLDMAFDQTLCRYGDHFGLDLTGKQIVFTHHAQREIVHILYNGVVTSVTAIVSQGNQNGQPNETRT